MFNFIEYFYDMFSECTDDNVTICPNCGSTELTEQLVISNFNEAIQGKDTQYDSIVRCNQCGYIITD